MAGLAPIAFRDKETTRSSTALMALLIVGIALAIFLSAAVNATSAQQALEGLGLFPVKNIDSTAETEAATNAGLALVSSFFNQTQETLGMYLLMLFGLTLTKKA